MAFPDRLERTVRLARPPPVVWAALTTTEGLASWFGDRAEIDLRVGGTARITWTAEGTEGHLRLERVEEPRVLGFTWRVDGMPPDDPRRTYVEITLEPDGTGTRLHLVETGFAQLPDDRHRTGRASHAQGWTRELGELVDAVAAL